MKSIHGIKVGRGTSIFRAAKSNGLGRLVKNEFPQVTKVYDSRQAVALRVTKDDVNSSTPKSHTKCAVAKSVCRALKADGAYIGKKTAYVVYGKTAIRCNVPESVYREITATDRMGRQGFREGDFRLSAVPPSQQMGVANGRKGGPHRKKRTNSGVLIARHKTLDIRP